MQPSDDNALLREYVERDSEDAFAELVARHVSKVYSVALRHTGNADEAAEITQAVFVILARKSRTLSKGVILSGWLYLTARLTSVTYIRSEVRRRRREQEAYMRSTLNENESEVWPQIAPLLDAAMAGLNETDRHAVVLRFFDGKSLDEVADALGANEEAAKKRVTRAVEKLRRFFAKRGIVLPAAMVTAAISANSVQAAPAVLAKTATAMAVTKGATASASTLTLIKGALKFMAWTKAKTSVMVAVIALLAAGTATTVVVSERRANFLAAMKILKTVEAKYRSFSTFSYKGEGVIQLPTARHIVTFSGRLARPFVYRFENEDVDGTKIQQFTSWATDDYAFSYSSETNKLYKIKTTLEEHLARYDSLYLDSSLGSDIMPYLFFNQQADGFPEIFSRKEQSLRIERLDDGAIGSTECYRLRVTLPQHSVIFTFWIGKTDHFIYQTEQTFEKGEFNGKNYYPDTARVTYYGQSSGMQFETNDFIPEVPANLKLAEKWP